ncbi:M24 family metallopeptidase, partial [Candidatus Peregrinibacteria bacterium]|nr:M24 family metallopeptidase [Candidatus Peregrinibacteria bacterium]
PAIVAFGKNSAIPHHKPGMSALKKGDTVLIDFGVLYHGYCSDMTRTFFFQELDSRQEEIYKTVLAAQQLGMQNIKVSKSCIGAYESVLKFFAMKNLQEYFTHSLGHGVGVEIHEAPSLAKTSKERFRESEIVTCEPGLYFPGEFGVRIEDLGVVKKEGYEVYTKDCRKDLRIIG